MSRRVRKPIAALSRLDVTSMILKNLADELPWFPELQEGLLDIQKKVIARREKLLKDWEAHNAHNANRE